MVGFGLDVFCRTDVDGLQTAETLTNRGDHQRDQPETRDGRGHV